MFLFFLQTRSRSVLSNANKTGSERHVRLPVEAEQQEVPALVGDVLWDWRRALAGPNVEQGRHLQIYQHRLTCVEVTSTASLQRPARGCSFLGARVQQSQ